jgi:hypothetical protein
MPAKEPPAIPAQSIFARAILIGHAVIPVNDAI